MAEPEALPEEGHLFGRIDTPDTASYHLRPFGRPLIEAFIAGDAARALDGEPDGALADFAIEELVNLLGSDMRAKLTPVAHSNWLASPFVGGAYSHARPGHADAREILARPVADRVFFAGEACSREFFSTGHGAFESGVAAADLALAQK
jgi:monoamine oxidase